MGINITVYKWKNATVKQVAQRLIVGFTGTLKNLWDNYLTKQNKADIQNVVSK